MSDTHPTRQANTFTIESVSPLTAVVFKTVGAVLMVAGLAFFLVQFQIGLSSRAKYMPLLFIPFGGLFFLFGFRSVTYCFDAKHRTVIRDAKWFGKTLSNRYFHAKEFGEVCVNRCESSDSTKTTYEVLLVGEQTYTMVTLRSERAAWEQADRVGEALNLPVGARYQRNL